MNGKEIHDVIVSKGFWTRPMDTQQGLTWAQLGHVLIEWGEYINAGGKAATLEEAADVWIVINDLLAQHGCVVEPGNVVAKEEVSAVDCIAETMNTYRKFGKLPSARLIDVLGLLKCIEGEQELMAAVEMKMRTRRLEIRDWKY
jgi:hypothetical protein